MSAPIALGAAPLPPSPPERREPQGERAANALTAPTTPGRRLPVVDRTKVDPQVLKAAQGMEAMFLDYLMHTMRQTVPKNEMNLENPATEIYRGMLDTETAQRAAHAGGVGLADQIIAYLQPQSYTRPKGPDAAPMAEKGNIPPNGPSAVSAPSTGGTHEGQFNE